MISKNSKTLKDCSRIILLFLSIIFLFACKEQDTFYCDNGTILTVIRSKRFGQDYNKVYADGSLILKGHYWVKDCNTSNGSFTVINCKTLNYAQYDLSGNIIIPFSKGYDQITQFKCPCGIFSIVELDDHKGLFDENGNMILEPKYRWIYVCPDFRIKEEINVNCIPVLLPEKYSNLFSFINLSNRQMSRAYEDIHPIDINHEKEEILRERYVFIHDPESGLEGIYDLYLGTEVIPTKYFDIDIIDYADYFVVWDYDEDDDRDLQGCYDLNGHLLLSVRYDGIEYDADTRTVFGLDEDGEPVNKRKVPQYKVRNEMRNSTYSFSGTYPNINQDYTNEYSPLETSSSGLDVSYYRNRYNKYAQMVMDNISTLPLLEDSYSSQVEMRGMIRDEQREMSNIRMEAERNGCYIEASPWESASY